jgi:hypothetical protein
MSLEESAILGNDSGANFGTPNLVGNSSTMTNSKEMARSPKKLSEDSKAIEG